MPLFIAFNFYVLDWLFRLSAGPCFFHLIEQELDSDMRKCKEEFKEFERQDVKHREDLKHLNQKIKKLEDKAEKVSRKFGL